MSTISDTALNCRQVSVSNVRRYLLGRGWKLIPSERSQVLCFADGKDDDGKQIVVTFPDSVEFSDYHRCVADLARALSVIESRDEEQVLDDLATASDSRFAGA